METKCLVQITETVAPSTGREASAGEERNWESFPQPAGWSANWDHEGLLRADVPLLREDLPQTASEDVEPSTGTKR